MQAVRSFFLARGYLEVDTPVRLPVPLPESHIKPFAAEGWYLQSSPEQCMKRLLAGGCERLFQICHCFRKEESGRYHQPEFTLLEWYQRGWSYLELMDECETFVREMAGAAKGLPGIRDARTLVRSGRTISLSGPWQRLRVADAFRIYTGSSVHAALAQDMFDELLVTRIEPNLGWDTPVFLYDYPVELGSLARSRQDDPAYAERFELYVGGIELANGFSELTDAHEQRQRFIREMELAAEQGTHYPGLPEKFLADLADLGETAGIALGLDRLFMVLCGCETVSEVMCLSMEEL